MRKNFILTLIAVVMLLGACVEQHNRVVLEKFVPITTTDQCAVKVGGDKYYTRGEIDLAFTDRYLLPFQITNYMSSSKVSDVGSADAPISSGETNSYYIKWVEVKYEFYSDANLDGNLWGGKRIEVHGVVATPEGGQNAGAVDIFSEEQAKDLLKHVNDIDWVAYPLIINMKVVGEITDGTEIETNSLNFNIVPSFGESIQMGSTYREPEGGFPVIDNKPAICAQFDAIMSMCAFNEPIVNGCFVGQDSAMTNCYGGDTEWQKYIATSRCNLDPAVSDCYYNGYGAYSVVEVVYNKYKKSPTDKGYYWCCPGTEPEEPEECTKTATEE
ncbi:MAG TPA: hypothetical protein PKG52_03860 [bacterium]|nr:hypothetical protein [bacterium]HPS28865.1 hypothetical protein [bacterium]